MKPLALANLRHHPVIIVFGLIVSAIFWVLFVVTAIGIVGWLS